jgi:hypothetical protein
VGQAAMLAAAIKPPALPDQLADLLIDIFV